MWLARHGWRVFGIDLAPTAIRTATLAAGAEGLPADFAVADLRSWKPDRAYDLVISTYALPVRGPGRDHALAAAVGAVGIGGTLLITELDESLARQAAWRSDDLTSIDDIVPLVADWEVTRAEVAVRAHSHADHTAHYPIVMVVARRPAD